MSARADVTTRIASLLGVDAEQLPDLHDVPVDDLEVLLQQLGDSVHRAASQRLVRVAGLAGSLPPPVAAKMAETFLPPSVAARVTEALEPRRARAVVDRLSVRYLADVAVRLDPVRSRDVVRALPPARIGDAARELFARDEHEALARLCGAADRAGLAAAVEQASPHDLLAVVPLLSWSDDLDHVIAHLPPSLVGQVVRTLTTGELADLALALDPVRFGPVVAQVDDARLAEIAAALLERDEVEAMGRFAGVLTESQLDAVWAAVPEGELERVRPHLDADVSARLTERTAS